jgi:N-acetylglutamate synthase-like GNAT family acetyltransferase
MNERSQPGTGLIQIVPFAPTHADAVAALIVGIQRDEFQIPITLKDQPDLEEIPVFYQHGAGNFWVAVLEGEVVGTVALLDLGNHQAALRKMFVHAACRGPGHGVSARLLETLLEWSRSRGVKEVYLGTTEKFLAAHRFYERNGFQQVTASELPSAFPKMAVDTRFYRLRTPFR